MSLTIKPVSGVNIVSFDSGFEDVNSGPIFISFGQIDTVRDLDGDEIVSQYQGFIRTTPSSWIPKAHDCDNLQVNGDLLDFRFFPDVINHSFQGPRTPISSVGYMNNGSFIPFGVVTTFSCIKYFYFTRKWLSYELPFVMCVYSNTIDVSWFVWPLYVPPELGTPEAFSSPTLTCRRPSFNSLTDSWSAYYGRKSLNGMGTDYTTNGVAHVLLFVPGNMTNWLNRRTPTGPFPSYHRTLSETTIKVIRDYYSTNVPDWLTALDELSSVDATSAFGELHYRALCKIDTLDINGIAYLKDLRGILKELKDLFQLLKGKITPKSISSLYLSLKYGLPLTYQDTKEVVKSFKTIRRSGVSATDVYGIGAFSVKCVSTIRYKPLDTRLEDTYNLLRRLDLLVNPENLWDLVPFSFVVDWFYNIGSLLEQLDQIDHLSHLKIDAVYDSFILNGSCLGSRLQDNIVGSIEFRRYKRFCHWDASFPLIAPSTPNATSHWLEGTALIIQKLFSKH